MLRGVNVIYCEVKKEGYAVCFLHSNLLRPPVGKIKVPNHINEMKKIRRFVESLVKKAGLVIEVDPHNEGVFHIFKK